MILPGSAQQRVVAKRPTRLLLHALEASKTMLCTAQRWVVANMGMASAQHSPRLLTMLRD